MILYSHIPQRQYKNLEDAANLISDLEQSCVTAQSLLSLTKGNDSFADACALVNVVFIEFLKDDEGYFSSSTEKGKIKRMISTFQGSETKELNERLGSVEDAISEIVIISENDGGSSEENWDALSQILRSFSLPDNQN